MKLHKKISVGGNPFPLDSHNCQLNLMQPGTAVFTVASTTPLEGIVQFSMGYDSTALKPWFMGFIESSTKVDEKQQRLFCREISAMLFPRMPIALRGVTLQEVVAAVADQTQLPFVLPDVEKSYTTKKVGAFYNVANGYYLFDSLAKVFGIEKHVWQQQADGSIYVGSWNDSSWAKKPAALPNHFENQVKVSNGATVPAIPSMRPGVLYNGSVLTSVELFDSKMRIEWDKNPWGKGK